MFSNELRIKRGLEVKIRQAKVLARTGNAEFKLRHPAEARDASGDNPQYTLLVKRLKDENAKFHDERKRRNIKLGHRI